MPGEGFGKSGISHFRTVPHPAVSRVILRKLGGVALTSARQLCDVRGNFAATFASTSISRDQSVSACRLASGEFCIRSKPTRSPVFGQFVFVLAAPYRGRSLLDVLAGSSWPMRIDHSHPHRRAVPPEVERRRLRRHIADLYRADPRYRLIVRQDLKPLWRKASSTAELPVVTFESLRAALKHGRPDPGWDQPVLISALATYVKKVESTVASTLRLTYERQPADWAVTFLHADVADRDPFSPPDDYVLEVPILPDEDLSMVLTVWPTFAKLEMFADGQQFLFVTCPHFVVHGL